MHDVWRLLPHTDALNVPQIKCLPSPQAEELGAHLRALPPSLQPEVVMVSPLRRTLETAVGVFGGGPVLNGDAAAGELLMVAMEETPQARMPGLNSSVCAPSAGSESHWRPAAPHLLRR